MAPTLRTATDVRAYLLRNWRGILPELLAPRVRVRPAADDDGLVQVDLLDPIAGGSVERLLLLPQASGEPRLLRGLLPRLRQLAGPADTAAGFVVPHMGAAGMRLCREAGVGFIDCCGNAGLRFNQVIVQIAGNRNRFSSPKRPRTLFHDKATIPMRILLERPRSWLTTREIAERGQLSLGWVSQILQRLDADGYVERKRGGGSRLREPRRLLDEWLEQYAFEQNRVYPFRLREGGVPAALERLRELPAPLDERYALTLDAAVSTLAGDAPLTALHLYLPDAVENEELALEMWREALGLRPAGHGAECFLVRPTYPNGAFFGVGERDGLQVVSDLQLYLDLFHYPSVQRHRARATIAARLPFPMQS